MWQVKMARESARLLVEYKKTIRRQRAAIAALCGVLLFLIGVVIFR